MNFRQSISIFFITILWMSSASALKSNQSYYRNFWYPTYYGQRLNYCSINEKNCGFDVANAYCQYMNYDKAEAFIIDYNIGLSIFIGTNRQCKGWECNGFMLIKCKADSSRVPPPSYYYRLQRFICPSYSHYRVDWCYQNGQGCGLKAAHSFCRRMGYRKAKSFKLQHDVPITKALGNQKLCFSKNCTGYSEIICFR